MGGRSVRIAIVAVPLIAVASAIYYLRQPGDLRNVQVVKEGVLYRSAQLPLSGLQKMADRHGIKTVVSLRVGDDPVELAEEAYCKANNIKFVRFVPKHWSSPEPGAPAPVEENLAAFCDVMADPVNHPVLVHCYAGIHRTGAYVAIYRMEFEGWSNEQTMAELRSRGYSMLDDHKDIHEFMKNYRPVRGQVKTALR